MGIGDLRHLCVLSCRQPARFFEAKTDKEYEHVTLFLHALLIQDLNRASFFLSKQSVLFLRDMFQDYGNAAAVS